MELNILRYRAYKTACEHGFHEEELSDKHFLMLVITELSESVEADRKGRLGDIEYYKLLSKEHIKSNPEYLKKLSFNRYVKDSVGDELADAAIRLLDLAGLRDVRIFRRNTIEDLLCASYSNIEFTECIFGIVSNITMWSEHIDTCISSTLERIFALAESRGIDLLWHINEKMKYNELRPNKHGKLY